MVKKNVEKREQKKYVATLNDWLSMGDKEATGRSCLSELEDGKDDLIPDLDQLGRKPNKFNPLLIWRNA